MVSDRQKTTPGRIKEAPGWKRYGKNPDHPQDISRVQVPFTALRVQDHPAGKKEVKPTEWKHKGGKSSGTQGHRLQGNTAPMPPVSGLEEVQLAVILLLPPFGLGYDVGAGEVDHLA